MAGLGLVTATYLLVVTCGVTTADRPPHDPTDSCYDRVVHQAARLTDC